MENENVTVTLTVAQWTAIYNIISSAPFNVVNTYGSVINDLQNITAAQFAEIKKNYPDAA